MFTIHRRFVSIARGVRYTGVMRAWLGLSIVSALWAYALPTQVWAAHLYLDPPGVEHGRTDTFSVPVRIDTQGDCINAVSVHLAYDPTALSVVDVGIGSSIISLWTVRPMIERGPMGEAGRVVFEGGIPGGYCGRVSGDLGAADILAELVVTGRLSQGGEGVEAVRTSIVVDPATAVYRNDGSGAAADLTVLGADLTFVAASSSPVNTWLEAVKEDTLAPELFDIILVKGPSVGSGKHYIVFSTTDKQSGIDHYEVLETDPERFGFLTWVPRESHWVRGESPYVLRDQELRSKILVKAVDKNGNERVIEYTPPLSLLAVLTYPAFLVPILALLVGVVGAVLGIVVWVRRVRGRRRRAASDGEI